MDTVEHIIKKYGQPTNGKLLKGVKRNDFYNVFRELGFTEGVEIGVGAGANARVMFDTVPGLKLHLVDCWLPVGKRTAEYQKRYYQKMRRALAPEFENGQANSIEKWSLDAVKDFEGKSLDFVYIDANHKFDYVIQDIIQWGSKVRRGGIVAGHDYHYFRKGYGVVMAVKAYMKAHKLNWYLLDNEKEIRKQTNNTWFFIKSRKARRK